MTSRAIIRWVVIIAMVVQLGRVLSVSSREGDTPFLSANDRSRWCTVASLVENGSFEIDSIIAIRNSAGRSTWDSIDKVQHVGSDGKLHFYSSKPPLLSVIVAGVYYVVYKLTGLALTEHPLYVARILLVCVNVVPLGIFWWLWMRSPQFEAMNVWPKLTVGAALILGTFMTTFVVTLNNHLPAAIAAGLSLILLLQVGTTAFNGGGPKRPLANFMLTGFFAGLTAAFELPALSWFVVLFALILWRLGWRGAAWYLVGATPVAGLFFMTNFWAHGDWRPAYDHRRIGELIASLPSRAQSDEAPTLEWLRQHWGHVQPPLSDSAQIVVGRFPNAWSVWDDTHSKRWIIVDEPQQTRLHESDDWYDYPGSYWRFGVPRGVDRGEKSRMVYAFHSTIGHHGIFSLTPIWLLGILGFVIVLYRPQNENVDMRVIAIAIAIVSIVCVTFYFSRPEFDRNYGGVSCCLRWVIWLSPLWLILVQIAVVSFEHNSLARAGATGLLLVSVLSSVYNWSNPWSHPWLFNFWSYLGWIHYP